MKRWIAVTVVCSAVLAQGSAATEPKSNYAGSYRRSGVDSGEQLILLEDGTYCYAAMAGSMDLLSAGRWKAAVDGIHFNEVKPKRSAFPLLARHDPNASGPLVIEFHGYSLSEANVPVFAMSDRPEPPLKFRRLFPSEKYTWSSSYRLPVTDPGGARYLFIGGLMADKNAPMHMQEDAASQPLTVLSYRVGAGVNQVRIGYDQRQAMPPLNLQAKLVDGDLQTGEGERPFVRNKDPLTADYIEGVRKNCIHPALLNQDAREVVDGERPELQRPLRTFSVRADRVLDEPWFAGDGDDDE